MARRMLRRSTLFTLIALVGLLSLGIGYAAWNQTLTINGDVTTGTFDVQWTTPSASITDNPLGSSSVDCDIANPTAYVFDVNLINGYPGVVCTVTATVTNTGTVPADATALSFTPADAPATAALDFVTTSCDLLNAGPNADGVIPVGDSVNCSFTVGVDPDPNNSDETTTYEFTVTADYGI